MSSCSGPSSAKLATYSVKGIKPCVSAPSCSAHKHRPRPAPCPRPDECYKACIRKKQKCPSAMEVVTRPGNRCRCELAQARSSRYTRKRAGKSKCEVQRHRTRIKNAYKRRSMISRWRPQDKTSKCCTRVCPGCCQGCTIL
ncbi:uncharacterized protein LOC134668562 [Cydia fagiglandana]|uniref:uncharacterized protein LOC134668562 n=1 Tax=Cydia fagiglandana TaxID=1458189 RepID=UPI002FEE4A0C